MQHLRALKKISNNLAHVLIYERKSKYLYQCDFEKLFELAHLVTDNKFKKKILFLYLQTFLDYFESFELEGGGGVQ